MDLDGWEESPSPVGFRARWPWMAPGCRGRSAWMSRKEWARREIAVPPAPLGLIFVVCNGKNYLLQGLRSHT